MSEISESNPLGILGFDHLEFTCDNINSTESRPLFYQFGFEKKAENPDLPAALFSQGQVRFLLTSPEKGHARDYFNAHGEGVSKMSFLVENAEHALREALNRGAELHSELKV
ncbi:MAG: hypothetical protein ACPGJV_13715, partial [Bacteriovoracaceae bacterium]